MQTARFAARLLFVTTLVLVCAPGAARAQSAIAGVVRDTTGAVMPGVTVEASSPALIERVRSVVSDGQGQYKIVDLRPGIYAITFTLPGFNTVKRDAVELPTNFTATVNAELRVGALEETVTVSGASPVVDVQNAVQQTVLSRQVLDAVPTGRSIPTLGALMPGARLALPDVGGMSGMQNRDLTVHGSDGRDTTFQVDGMTLNGIEGDGSVQSYFNEAMFEEISYQTSAINAEVSAGGVRANMIPRDGGNQFRGTMFFSAANQDLQSDNSKDAKAAGLAAPDSLNKVWDFNVSEGGPIVKNQLWFFASYRDWGVYQYIANSFYKNGDQAIDDANIRSGVVRLTAQLNEKNKVSAYLDRIRKFRGHENSAPAGYAVAEEATDIRAPKQYYTTEAKWTSTVSSKLLLEAGIAINNESHTLEPVPEGVGVNKYVRAYSTGFAEAYDPNFYSAATLTWNDVNRDDTAQGALRCVYLTPGCEIDFSTLPSTFGVKPSQNPADGIGRPYQIETNVSVQREIVPGASVTLSYFRRDYKNLIWSDNLAINPSDYTAFTVPNPIGGDPVTLYNLNPAKASAVDILDQNSWSNYRKYDGYDIGFNGRRRNLTLFGGVSMGHQVSNTCEVEDKNFLRYCDQGALGIPYYTQVKVNGSYVLPWQISISGTLQSYPGDARNSTVDGTTALNNGTILAEDPSLRVVWSVDRTLFRSLTGQTLTQTSINVPLNAPGTKFLGRQNQLDIRLKKIFRVRGITLEAQADAYNALNTGVVLTSVQTLGTALDRPASILQGRLFRFGMQAKF